jgi:hypothetical protein
MQSIQEILSTLHNRFEKTDILYDDIKTIDYCYTSTHDYCCVIIKLINHYINNKIIIPDQLITRFFKIFGNQIECWSLNYNDNIKMADYIFKNHKFSDKNIEIISRIEYSEIISMFLNSYTNMNKNIDEQILNKLLSNNTNYELLCDYILKNNNLDQIQILLESSIKNFDSRTIIKLLDNKITFSQNLFIKILRIACNMTNGLDLIKKCIINGAKIEKNMIRQLKEEILDKLNYYYNNSNNKSYTDNYETIIPFLYDNGSTDIIMSDILELSIGHNSLQNIINNLLDNDLEITKNDFICLCKMNIKVNNIKKIQKYFDDPEVSNILYKSNSTFKYPITIKYTLDMLKNELRSGTTQKIKEILKIVAPTQECMELACKSNNLSIIKILHDTYKLKINEQCVINHSNNLRHNTLLNYIRAKYVESLKLPNNNMLEDLDDLEDLEDLEYSE